MRRLIENYAELPSLLRRPMWKLWHKFILSREKREVALTCMNYGYADLDKPETIELLPRDENERYGMQLYHQAASWVDVTALDLLEVGAGRGGGASYITRYLKPKSYTGVDLSDKGIAFCNTYHDIPNLTFIKGDAEDLPFDDNSFDGVVNVESSRCYPHIERFFAEVMRVLKPGGHFLITDMRWEDDVVGLREGIKAHGFELKGEKNISQNVVRALDVDNTRRTTLMAQRVPKFLIKAFGEFAGVQGSGRYNGFASGKMQYWSFWFQKPAAS